MQKMVVLSSFSVFFFNYECSIIVDSIIELTYIYIGWIDFGFVCFEVWICV